MQSRNGRGVQQAEVSAAADALLAQGQRPTVDRVRRQLGRGSPNTVGPMLEAWFVGLAPRLGYPSSENGAVNAPPAEIRQAMDALWHLARDQARQEARKALEDERDQLQSQRSQLNEERSLLARDAAALVERDNLRNAALDRAQGQVDELALQLRDMQATLQQRESELRNVRVCLARAVEAKDAVQVEHQQAIQALLEERRRQEERFNATERRHLEEVDRSRQEAKSAQRLLTDSEGRAAAQRKNWEETLQLANGQIQALKTGAAELRACLVASEKRIHDLRELAIRSRKSKPTNTRARRSKSTTVAR
ncbi:MAG: DNA-binding protein [Hylemonella sp.]|uniref:DNA-binding protein n=1 Tax=Hylemonella sp. TaxID=2066020 RepID=UPI00391D54FD